MTTANTEYLIGTFLLMAARVSPVVFCMAARFGQRLPERFPPRRWYRVVLYWAGACGAAADVACIYLAATFDAKHHFLLGKFDRIDSSFLSDVPTVFLTVIGCYTVTLGLALGLLTLKTSTTRIGKVLRNEPQHGYRCPLSRRCPCARHLG
jgi:NhaP-type Na+/H+ or K+/H+ antiporter